MNKIFVRSTNIDLEFTIVLPIQTMNSENLNIEIIQLKLQVNYIVPSGYIHYALVLSSEDVTACYVFSEPKCLQDEFFKE